MKNLFEIIPILLLTTTTFNFPNSDSSPFLSGAKAGFCVAISHWCLEYMSTFIHEHGHGLSSRGSYTIEVTPCSSLFAPIKGVCHLSNNSYHITSLLAGPTVGILTTYLQCIGIKLLHGYLNNKPLKKSLKKSLIYPFLFFKKSMKKGKQDYSKLVNHHNTQKEKEPSILKILLLLRMGRIIGESIYGFLPYSYKDKGDGEKIWKQLLGPNCPTIKGNLTCITIIVLATPYVMGMLQEFYEDKVKKLS